MSLPSHAAIEAQLCTYIMEKLAYDQPHLRVTPTLDLLTQRLIDSLGMVRLCHFIEETFAITIEPDDLVMSNFATVAQMATLIQAKVAADPPPPAAPPALR